MVASSLPKSLFHEIVSRNDGVVILFLLETKQFWYAAFIFQTNCDKRKRSEFVVVRFLWKRYSQFRSGVFFYFFRQLNNLSTRKFLSVNWTPYLFSFQRKLYLIQLYLINISLEKNHKLQNSFIYWAFLHYK